MQHSDKNEQWKLIGAKEPTLKEAKFFERIIATNTTQNYGTAIDVGAHVGSWTVEMAKYFRHVEAFEPTTAGYDMLLKNTSHLSNVRCWNYAIMDKCGHQFSVVPGRNKKGNKEKRTLTSYHVVADPNGTMPAINLDSIAVSSRVGFIKIDVEGAEPLVLQGAKQLIKDDRPTLCVEFNKFEQWGWTEDQLQSYIEDKLRYKEFMRSGVDRVFLPRELS